MYLFERTTKLAVAQLAAQSARVLSHSYGSQHKKRPAATLQEPAKS